jgi:hypothetical protein
MAQEPLVGQSLLIIKASRSHSGTPHSVGFLWLSDQTDAETSTWRNTTFTKDRHPCPRRDFFFHRDLFFPVPFFPFDPFCTSKSFRPSSSHFMFHTSPYTTNTTQTSLSLAGFVFFFACPGFFPFDPFLYCLNPFVLHVTLRSILPSFQQTQHKHPCPRWDSNPRS